MNDGTLLTALIAVVLLCFVPLGAFRGGLREALEGGAILFGGALASLKAAEWGDRLADRVDIRPSLARLDVGLGILLGSWLVLGLLGGALCDRRLPSAGGRLLGAGLAAANAALLAAFALQLFERFYRDGAREAPIADSWLARNLIDRSDLILIAAGAFMVVAILCGHLLHRIVGVGYSAEIEPALTWVQHTKSRARSVRIPVDADEGKIEPPHEDGRAWTAARLAESQSVVPPRTRPVEPDRHRPEVGIRRSSDELSWDESASRTRPEPEPVEPPGDSILDRWLRESGNGKSDARSAEEPFFQAEHPGGTRMSDSDRPGVYAAGRSSHCPACGSWLADATLPCPFCGGRSPER